ncbi:hypothetical protein F2Q70_00011470 [Brassica cretica]|uniref:F-box domain-containing protein n=1 Tax=Brassica cretica TaxID=69181 RepID=A0A8S9LTH0_BRACR|nr:hypothetical protein F2Q70_00011470 [Brassica cretica]
MENLNLTSVPPSILHQILSKVATNTMRNFEEVNVVRTFRLRCYHLGNPEAMYLRDGMVNLAFSVDDRGLVHNYPGFTCEHVDRMSHMITTRELSGHWDYDKHWILIRYDITPVGSTTGKIEVGRVDPEYFNSEMPCRDASAIYNFRHMENLNLAFLPPSILHQILSKVATNSIRDFGSARIAFIVFSEIGREYYFYRNANLNFLNECIEEVNAVRIFRLRCLVIQRPST